MTKETTVEFRRGCQDMILVIESEIELVKQHAKPEEIPGLDKAMAIVAAMKPPRFIR